MLRNQNLNKDNLPSTEEPKNGWTRYAVDILNTNEALPVVQYRLFFVRNEELAMTEEHLDAYEQCIIRAAGGAMYRQSPRRRELKNAM